MTTIVHTDPAPTLDDVWRLFREMALETERRSKEMALETERRSKEMTLETERRSKEMTLEMELRSKENERRSQEFDRELKELRQLCKEHNESAEKRAQEAEKRSKAIDRQFRETDKKIGELGNRLGQFVEGFVAPAAVRLFRGRKIEITGLTRNIERENNELGLATQIDLMAINGDVCVVIEVKSSLSVDDINDHLERLEKFKLLLPEYKHHKVYGAVAGMVIPTDVGRYAYRKGFFVIGQTGEAVKILNDDKFKPAEW